MEEEANQQKPVNPAVLAVSEEVAKVDEAKSAWEKTQKEADENRAKILEVYKFDPGVEKKLTDALAEIERLRKELDKKPLQVARAPSQAEIKTYLDEHRELIEPREPKDSEIEAYIAAHLVEPSQKQVTALLDTESGRKKLEDMLNTDAGQFWLASNLE